MTIVPANETTYRLKVRRRLTLDLFTRYGLFWQLVDDLRRIWHIAPKVAVPPEPNFSAEAVGLMDRLTMPERFHMPDGDPYTLPGGPLAGLEKLANEDLVDDPEARKAVQDFMAGIDSFIQKRQGDRSRVEHFLMELSLIWRSFIPEDARDGANETGWMTWAPFLSACIIYDPPPDRLLEFANHDDDNAAALNQRTFSEDQRLRKAAHSARKNALKARDEQGFEEAVGLLQASMQESNASMMKPGRGSPKRQANPLRDVQCAVMALDGKTPQDIGMHLGMAEYEYRDPYSIQRKRPNAVEKAIRRGKRILKERDSVRLKSGQKQAI